jgi:hypothetical protein
VVERERDGRVQVHLSEDEQHQEHGHDQNGKLILQNGSKKTCRESSVLSVRPADCRESQEPVKSRSDDVASSRPLGKL